jgi:hypothetical protein
MTSQHPFVVLRAHEAEKIPRSWDSFPETIQTLATGESEDLKQGSIACHRVRPLKIEWGFSKSQIIIQ